MMNEEEYISQKLGKHNPFRVPEGYFDNLADHIISQLPKEQVVVKESPKAQKHPAIIRFLRPVLAAAACVAIAIGGVTLYLNNSSSSDSPQQLAQQQEVVDDSDTYIDEVADYAMFSNDDIYASLLADI